MNGSCGPPPGDGEHLDRHDHRARREEQRGGAGEGDRSEQRRADQSEGAGAEQRNRGVPGALGTLVLADQAERLAGRGYVVANIEYRRVAPKGFERLKGELAAWSDSGVPEVRYERK